MAANTRMDNAKLTPVPAATLLHGRTTAAHAMVARKRLGSVSAAFHCGDVPCPMQLRIPANFTYPTKGHAAICSVCRRFIDATYTARPRTRADEDVGMDTRPATNDIMAVFMDRDR